MRTQSVRRWIASLVSVVLAAGLLVVASPRSAEASDGALKWAPPELVNPITVNVTAANASLRLDTTRDYRIHLVGTLSVKGGLTIVGGRNVVLIGGSIIAPSETLFPAATDRRALYLKGQVGTVHIEGLHIGGDVAEGINLDERNKITVQLQNIKVDLAKRGAENYNANVLRTWGGPKTMRVDRFDAATEYQGLFMMPRQYDSTLATSDWSLSNMRLQAKSSVGMALYKDRMLPISMTNVSVGRAVTSMTPLHNLTVGDWPGLEFDGMTSESPLSGAPGDGYASPGYMVADVATTTTTELPIVPAAPSIPAPVGPLKWAPPVLENPIELGVSSRNPTLKLDNARDYRLTITDTIRSKGGLRILGGRSVVLIGGQVIVPTELEAPDPMDRRGLYFKGQTGTVHIEGLHIGGADLSDAINIDERSNNVVQLQNLKVDTVRKGATDFHADIVQIWAGPKTLRVDRLDGSTDYQGLFMLPHQQWSAAVVSDWELRNVRIQSKQMGGVAVWKERGHEIALENVRVGRASASTTPLFNLGASEWPGLMTDAMIAPDVTTGNPGMEYVSPGYVG